VQALLLKGEVFEGMRSYKDASDTYRRALATHPGHRDLENALKRVQNKQKAVENPFCAADMMDRLRASSTTKAFMEDAAFVSKLEELRAEPTKLIRHMEDERIVTALTVLMNINFPMPGGGGGGGDPLVRPPPQTLEDLEDLTGEPGEVHQTRTNAPTRVAPPDRSKALEEKENGNAAYKKKEFDVALQHYDRALELDPTNITFLTNKAAVYYEQADWEQCLRTCDLAVERGREHRADFKIIAKALARMGNVYWRQEKWLEAVRWYDKSLAEHRNPDIVSKKNEALKRQNEEEMRAYIDPAKSLEEKGLGNACFKEGRFPDAIKHYNEAMKRNPDDAKIYSNRAACYQKLLEFSLALKDCEEAIRLDPTFVKAHVRKGHALLAMKDTMRAGQAFEKALELDPQSADARTGVQRCMKQDDPEARRKAAVHDPEVQAILRDPAMQLILQQMQSHPEALRDHLQNPEIATKIQKLIECGFISLR
jgi:stress-induced-phosphoprotein 1